MDRREILVDNRREGSPAAEALVPIVSRHFDLHRVLEWTNGQEPPLHDVEVVTQDELTHDVIVTVAHDLHLVYDAT